MEVKPDYVFQQSRIGIERDERGHRLHGCLTTRQLDEGHSALQGRTRFLKLFYAGRWELLCREMHFEIH